MPQLDIFIFFYETLSIFLIFFLFYFCLLNTSLVSFVKQMTVGYFTQVGMSALILLLCLFIFKNFIKKTKC